MADPATYTRALRRRAGVLGLPLHRRIASTGSPPITDVVVVETHELKGNFDERYLAPLTEHFPAFRMLGESDVERLRAGGVRAVGVFARDESALLGALAPGAESRGRAAGRAGSRRARAAHPRRRRRAATRRRARSGSAAGAGTRRPPRRRRALDAGGRPGRCTVRHPRGDRAGGGRRVRGRLRGATGGQSGTVRLDVSAFCAGRTRSARCRPTGHPAWRERRSLGLTVAHDLLEPLGRYRALDSFESALDLDSRRCEPSLRVAGAERARVAGARTAAASTS